MRILEASLHEVAAYKCCWTTTSCLSINCQCHAIPFWSHTSFLCTTQTTHVPFSSAGLLAIFSRIYLKRDYWARHSLYESRCGCQNAISAATRSEQICHYEQVLYASTYSHTHNSHMLISMSSLSILECIFLHASGNSWLRHRHWKRHEKILKKGMWSVNVEWWLDTWALTWICCWRRLILCCCCRSCCCCLAICGVKIQQNLKGF